MTPKSEKTKRKVTKYNYTDWMHMYMQNMSKYTCITDSSRRGRLSKLIDQGIILDSIHLFVEKDELKTYETTKFVTK